MSAEADSKLRAAHLRELVPVHAYAESEATSRDKYFFRLSGRKISLVAKNVDESREFPARDGGENFSANFLYPTVMILAKFRRKSMGGHASGNHRNRRMLARRGLN